MSKTFKIFLWWILILGLPSTALAQFSVLSNNPPSIKWKQANSSHFKVIFPEGMENEGVRTLNTLQHLHFPVSKSLGKEPSKISIVLQNQNAISNGFVALAPRRSEFYTMPPQNYNFLGTNDWIDLLAVHELRHVVQFDKAITGMGEYIYYLFGEPALGAMAFIATPLWFWEGDAVMIETALTPSGRGRIPNFDLLYRTNLLERGGFNYNKQYLGSFRHQIPNWYVTGYHFVTHIRRHHDPGVWGRVTNHAFSWPIIPFTFSRGMKLETGQRLLPNYRSMNRELTELWTNQQKGLEITPSEQVNQRKRKAFTNYTFPAMLSDGSILVLRTGIGEIPQFVKIDNNGKEKVVFTPGIINDAGMLSVANDKIVWAEYEFDPRWRVRSYSVIKTYDIQSKTYKILTNKSRYSAPAFSPDASLIVAAHVSENSENSLVILDANTGHEVDRFEDAQNYLYTMPRWSDDGRYIVALKLEKNGKSLVKIDVKNKTEEILLPPSRENIGHPVMHGHYVYYNSPYNGIDNIYCLDLDTGERYLVTSKKYAAYNPATSADGQSMVFNNFSKDGMNVDFMDLDKEYWTPLSKVKDRNIHYYQPVVEQEEGDDILESVPDHPYPVTKYSKLKGIFNPYSWGPMARESDRELWFGIGSQDILSTTSITAGMALDHNERTGYGFGRISYQGLFPIIDLSGRIGSRTGYYKVETPGGIEELSYSWDEKNLDLGFRIPLILTRSKYLESLNLSTYASLTQRTNIEMVDNIQVLPEGTLGTMRYRASYTRMLRRSARDLRSKFGQQIFVHYAHTPFNGVMDGSLFATEGNLFLPGIAKHHSLNLRAGYMQEHYQKNSPYFFGSPLLFTRGYAIRRHPQFISTSVNYMMPIIYPDIHLGPFLYIQRFKTNLFHDYGIGYGANGNSKAYQSFGVDINMDFNIMRFLPMFDVGVRVGYVPELRTRFVELLIGQFGW
jgi:hypothetical protein